MAAILALAAGAALGQAPAAAPAFEVASIKPAAPLDANAVMSGKLHLGMRTDAARVDIGYLSLADLIHLAYRVKPFQISGPDWMGGQRFDIQAKIPEGASTDQVPEMLQALLAERFKLAVHRENTEQAVYALVVGKGGSKMKDAVPDPDVPAAPPAMATIRCRSAATPSRAGAFRFRADQPEPRIFPWVPTGPCAWKWKA
jgi:uncharacterized protein (TIGR03435 family)